MGESGNLDGFNLSEPPQEGSPYKLENFKSEGEKKNFQPSPEVKKPPVLIRARNTLGEVFTPSWKHLRENAARGEKKVGFLKQAGAIGLDATRIAAPALAVAFGSGLAPLALAAIPSVNNINFGEISRSLGETRNQIGTFVSENVTPVVNQKIDQAEEIRKRIMDTLQGQPAIPGGSPNLDPALNRQT